LADIPPIDQSARSTLKAFAYFTTRDGGDLASSPHRSHLAQPSRNADVERLAQDLADATGQERWPRLVIAFLGGPAPIQGLGHQRTSIQRRIPCGWWSVAHPAPAIEAE